MGKLTKIIFIVLIVFGIFLLISYYLGKQQLGGSYLFFSQKDFSQIESLISQEGKEEEIFSKEFISPDKKLKLQYFSDWIEIRDKEALEEIVPKEAKEKYNLKTLFFAGKLKKQSFSQLIVSEGIFEAEKSFEEIIDIMKESAQKEGWEMEIIKSEIKANQNVFEARYKKIDRYALHSKEKIILLDQKEEERKVYLIALIVYEKDWPAFEEEVNNIIDSAQLIE